MKTYKPNEFAEMIGVSVKALQRWDNDGKLKAYRNPAMGKIIQEKDKRKTIIYASVSSSS